jgi:hypothetical protein
MVVIITEKGKEKSRGYFRGSNFTIKNKIIEKAVAKVGKDRMMVIFSQVLTLVTGTSTP